MTSLFSDRFLVHRFRSSNHIKRLDRVCRTKCERRGPEEVHDSDTDVAEDGAGDLRPSTRLSQEPCFGVKVNSKRPAG
jgi:hypothetical protein